MIHPCGPPTIFTPPTVANQVHVVGAGYESVLVDPWTTDNPACNGGHLTYGATITPALSSFNVNPFGNFHSWHSLDMLDVGVYSIEMTVYANGCIP